MRFTYIKIKIKNALHDLYQVDYNLIYCIFSIGGLRILKFVSNSRNCLKLHVTRSRHCIKQELRLMDASIFIHHNNLYKHNLGTKISPCKNYGRNNETSKPASMLNRLFKKTFHSEKWLHIPPPHHP